MLLKMTLLVIAIVGQNEFYGAMKIKNKPICLLGYAVSVLHMMLIDKVTANGVIFTVSIFTISVLACLVIAYDQISVEDAAAVVLGFFYVSFLLSNIYLVREGGSLGIYSVWLIFISAWATDTGAYLTGKAIGKHKLAPELSPKKTVEGAVGGVVFATVTGICYALIVRRYFRAVDMHIILISTVMVFFGSIVSQLGDLAASSVKRRTNIKDFGYVIPGHGGVLDRFDSVLFTAPAVYCVLIIIGAFS